MKIILLVATLQGLLGLLNHCNAQTNILKGKVTIAKQFPINNAIVYVMSSKDTVLTNKLGRFTIHCKLQDKLIVKATGLQSQKIKIHNQNEIHINMDLKAGKRSLYKAAAKGHFPRDNFALCAIEDHLNANIDDVYKDIYDLICAKLPNVIFLKNSVSLKGIEGKIGIVLDGIIKDCDTLLKLTPDMISSIKIVNVQKTSEYGLLGYKAIIAINTIKQ